MNVQSELDRVMRQFKPETMPLGPKEYRPAPVAPEKEPNTTGRVSPAGDLK